ncbi:GDP-L-fucose synthase family protein [Sporofaciens musculi]|jgi:GDP-L-fucose synthase|uniref:GDP-L-fucose synthase family protein n=1 Tax=Sporofaciens musculi TaxID=2681861 RepID=UPI0025A14067|nr:GDP-L-fucose synthase [Sporofaciens musculi]
MNKDTKIYVAGHTGLVGSAFVRQLQKKGYQNLVLRTHCELDLTDQAGVKEFFEKEKPGVVIDAAAKVGGIKANSEHMAEFYYINMQIQQNLIWSAFENGTKKFLFLGSACMYPTNCEQPMREEKILTGLPELTNEGYALAKIGGSRLCSYLYRQYGVEFISAIPANAYGIGDSFDLNHSHVIPALIRRFHEAKEQGRASVTIWGTGMALREFINTDDMADAGIFLLNHYLSNQPINIGTGEEISMLELAEVIKKITGFEGEVLTDPSKPDGMYRRLCDSTRIHELGWNPQKALQAGLTELYEWYLNNKKLKGWI